MRIYWKPLGLIIVLVMLTTWAVLAQGPPLRRHSAIGKRPLDLVPATQSPPAASRVAFELVDGVRHVTANGMPNHNVGPFPNRSNPHAVRAQRYRFELPAAPQVAESITSIYLPSAIGPPNIPFGITLSGVLMDPGTAEFWQGDRQGGWNYEALAGAVPLGIDENHAHVQPNGSYHYHGLPHSLLAALGLESGKHSPQLGWAADGFPIYALYGYSELQDDKSSVVELKSSYRLKSGRRPRGPSEPGGVYDGTFVQDYEFIAGLGQLDECNGRFCLTPEFRNGTYAYFLTSDWPVIPRAFRGKPVHLR